MKMGNVRIKLSSTKKINNVNIYSDVDVTSDYLSKTLYDRAAIRSSIKNILTWKPYERILNPSFGNALWNNLFENIGQTSKNDIINTVKKMLSAEPRIKVGKIDVSANASANEISVAFSYTIPDLDENEEQYEITIAKQ
jgi:phage baseplate assembly protein W